MTSGQKAGNTDSKYCYMACPLQDPGKFQSIEQKKITCSVENY